jgi:hypothetical protein
MSRANRTLKEKANGYETVGPMSARPRCVVCSESSEPAFAGGNLSVRSCFAKTLECKHKSAAIAFPVA